MDFTLPFEALSHQNYDNPYENTIGIHPTVHLNH